MKKNKLKVIVVGIDGACWEIIEECKKHFKLQGFSLFLEKGLHGVLKTVIPPATSPAWKCYSTGLPPEKLDLFHWYVFDPKSKRIKLLTVKKNFKEIWDYLSEHGFKCVVINTPLTYPKKINGVLIAGPPLSGEKNFVYPKKYEKILKLLFKYRVCMRSTLQISNLLPEKIHLLLKMFGILEILRLAYLRFKVAKYLWKKFSPDFMQVTIFYTDHAQHYLANEFDKRLLLLLWKAIDRLLYNFIKSIEKTEKDDVIFILMSDHGHTHFKYTFLINNWLYRIGLLKIKLWPQVKNSAKSILFNLIRKNKPIRTFLLSKLGYSFLYKRLPNRIAGLRIRDKHKTSVKEILYEFIRRVFKEHVFKLKITELVNVIDWKRTLAFAPDWYYIFINADWNSKKFRKIREFLIKKLEDMRTPSKSQVFSSVVPGEIIFPEDICKKYGFSIIFIPEKSVRIDVKFCFANTCWMSVNHDEWSSVHTLKGIFGVYGRNLQTGKFIGEISILELAPMILSLFGIEKPNKLSEKVISLLRRKAVIISK